MNYKNLFFSAFLSLFSAISLYSQVDGKSKFSEALYLIDESLFSEALPLLESLEKQEQYINNANFNFNIGFALYKSFDEKNKLKAVSYLEKAAQNVSPRYQPLSIKENKAPIDAYYYLGLALHNNHQFSKAIENYNIYKTLINDKHFRYRSGSVG